MAADDITADIDPPVPDEPGHRSATLVSDRVVVTSTVESWAGPITVLVSAPCAADRVGVESAAYRVSNEVARLAALATNDSGPNDDD